VTLPRAKSAASRLSLLTLPEDPEEAFRIRAKADRARLLRLRRRVDSTDTRPASDGALAAVEELAHGLAGCGGVFGFPGISTAAAQLERLVERHRRSKAAFTAQQRAQLAKRIDTLIDRLALVGPAGGARTAG
jgi:chemotaxis protein histidine kinase CheA